MIEPRIQYVASAVHDSPLQVRIGLNGGEILASMAVRELCSGKGFLFADLGDHELRGFEDPVRVFEVKWKD